MSMQFWGVEVVSKEPAKVPLEFDQVIHLSQATLSDVKKASEPVTLKVEVEGKKFVLGVLSQSTPQLSFDLVFDSEFEISHNFKNGSVHFLGYQTEMQASDDELDSDSSDEDVPVLQGENGKSGFEVAKSKVAAKPGKDVKPKPEDDAEEDSSDESDTSDDLVDLPHSSDEDDDEDDDDEDDEDDDMSEDEKPAKAESGKKRPNVDAKTPESKKAKLVTPQKTDGKKGPHTATPHPSKKGGKTPVGDKSTPKSAGSVSCGSCNKTFNSENALQSHNKAKHAAK